MSFFPIRSTDGTLTINADGTIGLNGDSISALVRRAVILANDRLPLYDASGAPFYTDTTALATALSSLLTSTAAAGSSVPNVILDTDLASDCDDVGDLAMVCQAAALGHANLLAVVAGNLNAQGAAGAKVLLDYALPGHNVLIGQYNGTTLNTSSTYNSSAYLAQIVSRFGGTMPTFPNHVAAVRRALAVAPAGSVHYVMTGFGSALADVLASGPDAASPFSGAALFAAKVAGVWWEACLFNTSNGSGSTTEFNVQADVAAAQTICTQLAAIGVPLVFAGDEIAGLATSGTDRIASAPPSGTSPTTSPFEYAYELFGNSAANPRNAWGQVAVYSAIYGNGTLFGQSGNGTVTIASGGSNQWAASPAAAQSYLTRSADVATVSTKFNTLIAGVSGNTSGAGGSWGLGIGMPVASGSAPSSGSPSGGTVAPSGAPLDISGLPSAFAAWGLRKLRSAYAGSAVKVANSTDVGFTSGGDFNSPAAVAVSSNNTATTFYDQTGNSRSLLQSGAMDNAQLVVNGAVVGANSRAGVNLIASVTAHPSISGLALTGNALTLLAVASLADTDGYSNLFGFQADGQAHHYDNAGSASLLLNSTGTANVGSARNGASSYVAKSLNSLFALAVLFDGTNMTVYLNGTPNAPVASTGAWATGTLILGSVLDTSGALDNWAGAFAEAALYNTALTDSQIKSFQANQIAYYGIT